MDDERRMKQAFLQSAVLTCLHGPLVTHSNSAHKLYKRVGGSRFFAIGRLCPNLILLISNIPSLYIISASRLPIQLGSKVSSRLSARAVRAFLDSQPAQQRTNGAGTSSASAAAAWRAAVGTQIEGSGSEPPPTMADLTGRVFRLCPNGMTPSGGSVIMQPLSDLSPSVQLHAIILMKCNAKDMIQMKVFA